MIIKIDLKFLLSEEKNLSLKPRQTVHELLGRIDKF